MSCAGIVCCCAAPRRPARKFQRSKKWRRCKARRRRRWNGPNRTPSALPRNDAVGSLDELLAAEIADEQAWIQRGASLGYDLAKPHVAMLVEATNVSNWPTPLLRFVQQQNITAPYAKREEGILLFWPSKTRRVAACSKRLPLT